MQPPRDEAAVVFGCWVEVLTSDLLGGESSIELLRVAISKFGMVREWSSSRLALASWHGHRTFTAVPLQRARSACIPCTGGA